MCALHKQVGDHILVLLPQYSISVWAAFRMCLYIYLQEYIMWSEMDVYHDILLLNDFQPTSSTTTDNRRDYCPWERLGSLVHSLLGFITSRTATCQGRGNPSFPFAKHTLLAWHTSAPIHPKCQLHSSATLRRYVLGGDSDGRKPPGIAVPAFNILPSGPKPQAPN